MGNLRDQLKKAKILSQKDDRRLAHEERVRRKQLGREELEQQERARQEELARLREAEREKVREVQAELDRQRQERAERAACQDILEREARPPTRGGGARWHFALTDGRLPSLSLTEVERHQLQGGHLCLVRLGPAGSHVYGVLATPLARRLAATLPDRVVWSARGVLEGTSAPG